jgi:hypothetical protein
MHRAGSIAILIGILLIVGGLIAGFGLLFLDRDDEAVFFLSFIPVGFVLALGGLTTTLLFGPNRH